MQADYELSLLRDKGEVGRGGEWGLTRDHTQSIRLVLPPCVCPSTSAILTGTQSGVTTKLKLRNLEPTGVG